ncbi:MAG: hypothetical protein SFV24_12135 [Gemmatimonadales bacterium]|nr:hypothetical protein [Gemmatimonadales bacterium]
MTEFLAVLALGLLLGMRHATDADHVVAVTTIVTRQRNPRAAAMVGMAWGVGHTLTILVVGGAIIFFQWVIPPRVGLSMEFAVAGMLVLLGVLNLGGVLKSIRDAAATRQAGGATPVHSHGDYVHAHAHAAEPAAHPHPADRTPIGWLDRQLVALRAYRLVRPLLIGVVHGLAGSAAVALLVLTTIRDPRWSLVYLLLFGVGTIVGMMLITAAMAVPMAYSAARFDRVSHGLRLASGILSIGFGLFLAYQIGIVDGLFGDSPRWDPH